MPKYEYACKSCGERTEVKQSFQDDPLTECTTCGGPLRKVFSSPGIVLRGPGFYRTDHRSPYRPDGTRPAEREKDRDSAESKSSSDSDSSKSKEASESKKESKKESKESKGAEAGASSRSEGSGDRSGSRDFGSPDSGSPKDTARTA